MIANNQDSKYIDFDVYKGFSLELSNQLSLDFETSIKCYPVEVELFSFKEFVEKSAKAYIFKFYIYQTTKLLISFEKNILSFFAAKMFNVDMILFENNDRLSLVEEFVLDELSGEINKFFQIKEYIFKKEIIQYDLKKLHIAYPDDIVQYVIIPITINEKYVGDIKLCVLS